MIARLFVLVCLLLAPLADAQAGVGDLHDSRPAASEVREGFPDAEAVYPPGVTPSPKAALAKLKQGNARFTTGAPRHPDAVPATSPPTGTERTFATILAATDTQVPVERIFDLGHADAVVIRVADKIGAGDVIENIEYGLTQLRTPLLVVLGHTRSETKGQGSPEDRNSEDARAVLSAAAEEHVRQNISGLFLSSPAARRMAADGSVLVMGAIYDGATNRVNWLGKTLSAELLALAEADPARVLEIADGGEITARRIVHSVGAPPVLEVIEVLSASGPSSHAVSRVVTPQQGMGVGPAVMIFLLLAVLCTGVAYVLRMNRGSGLASRLDELKRQVGRH